MINTIIIIAIVFSALSAIVTSAFTYKFVNEKNYNFGITTICCVLAAVFGGAFWLPATLIVPLLFAKELRHA